MSKALFYQILSFVLPILKQLAEHTPTDIDDITVDAVTGAFRELQKVEGSPVTKVQLEELRTTKKW